MMQQIKYIADYCAVRHITVGSGLDLIFTIIDLYVCNTPIIGQTCDSILIMTKQKLIYKIIWSIINKKLFKINWNSSFNVTLIDRHNKNDFYIINID